MRRLSKARKISPEEQSEIATQELSAILNSEPGELSLELMGDLVTDAVNRLGQIPSEHCAECKAPVFVHEAIKIDGRFYCTMCAGRKSAS